MIVIRAVALIWWAPTLVLRFGRFFWHAASFQMRLCWAKVLRKTGHLDAAMRVLKRLEADSERVGRELMVRRRHMVGD